MTNFLKEQGVIWFRIIATVLLVGLAKLLWDSNTNMTMLTHSVHTLAEKMEIGYSSIKENTNNISNNKEQIAVNAKNIEVNKTKLDFLK